MAAITEAADQPKQVLRHMVLKFQDGLEARLPALDRQPHSLAAFTPH